MFGLIHNEIRFEFKEILPVRILHRIIVYKLFKQ
jgi:hypothetical protein